MSLKYKHLEERSKYEERYDRHTVEQSRRFEQPRSSEKIEQKKKGLTDEQVGGIFTFARDMFLHEFVGNRYLEREKIINEWMENDKRRDDMLAEARPPLLPCPSCRQTMECMDVYVRSDIDTDREWLEFYLHCKPCRKIRHVYQNGSEIPRKIFLCEKCQKELSFSTRKRKGKTYFVETCKHCGHVEETLDILEEKKKVPTPEEIERFEYDKKRFCLSAEQGRRYEQWQENMKRINGEEEEHKINTELYDRLAEVKKLNIAGLEKLVRGAIEKESYADLHIEMPPPEEKIIVNFSVRDTRDDRGEYDSRNTLKKTIERILEDKNWALTSEGVSYRLGMLSGRIRGYESEAELQELTKSRIKKKTKSEKFVKMKT